MPSRKPTTRRSISIRGLTYERLAAIAAREDKSMSGLLEDLIAAAGDAAGIPQPLALKPRPRPRRERNLENIISHHFTW